MTTGKYNGPSVWGWGPGRRYQHIQSGQTFCLQLFLALVCIRSRGHGSEHSYQTFQMRSLSDTCHPATKNRREGEGGNGSKHQPHPPPQLDSLWEVFLKPFPAVPLLLAVVISLSNPINLPEGGGTPL